MVRMVGWGMLLVVLDPRLNSFDVLPDVLGWALLLVGLADLRRADRDLALAWWAAWPGLAVSALHLAVFFSEASWPMTTALLDLAQSACWWSVAWWVLVGLAAVAIDAHGPGDLPRALAGRRLALALAVLGLVDVATHAAAIFLSPWRHRLSVVGGPVGAVSQLVLVGAGVAAVTHVLWEGRRGPLGWERAGS